MKTIIRTTLVAFFVCGGVLSVSAQSQEEIDYMRRNSDLEAAKEFQVKLDNDYKENHQRALDLARQNGWPLTINKPDGGFSELEGVTADGRPLYYSTSNHGSAITSRVDRIQPGGTAGLNLDGAGMLAGVWDEGRPKTNHVDLVGRISEGDNSSDSVAAHSTHVMGTILSSGLNEPLARGMAYKANGIWADWSNDLSEMQSAVTNKGLLVSNHSYTLLAKNLSQQYFGAYITASKDVDDLLFINPFYQPVWGAGNDRSGYLSYNSGKGGHDLLSAEGTAKNVIVVAAVNEVPSYTNAGSVVMSSFSNWGPTDDNRVKPDISTKGVKVYSTVSGSTTAYDYYNGTSMAAPGVTGALLLLQQQYVISYKHAVMRSATLRGLIAHTADEAGVTAQGVPGPDSMFGWGLLNAERAAKTITDSRIHNSIMNELTLMQGGTYTTTVFATGTEPLIATISWTDKGGVINEVVIDQTTPVLVNDLDIRVIKNGVTSMPWKLGGLAAPASKGDNTVDNIEKVEVDGTVRGAYTIMVTHKGILVGKDNLPSGAMPSQDFSLIVTGIDHQQLAVEQNDFKAFKVWPNPVNSLLNVAIQSDLSAEAFLTLYDIQGKRVIGQKLDGSDNTFGGVVNIDSLNPGIYLVKVTQGNKQSVRKIVKK